MKNPKDKTAHTVGSDTATKQKRFPIGKAFSRAGYFNLQRGLPPAARAGGRILPKAKAAGHAATRFVRAFRAKMSLTADFAHSAGLPVWRSLGPAIIPHGQTYGSAKPPVSGRCCGISVDPQDARKIIVCSAGGGLWGSNDAGVTWRPLTDEQPLLSMGALARASGSPNILYAGTGEGDNGIEIGVGLLRSKDGGATWTHVPSAALVGTAIYDIAVHPGDPQHLWIATISGLMSSRDGGSTCSRVRPGQCWSVSINPSNPQELLAAAADGLQRSLDGGATWTQMALPGLNDLRALRRMEVCHAPSNPGVAFVTAAINSPTAAEPEHGSGDCKPGKQREPPRSAKNSICLACQSSPRNHVRIS